MMVQAIVTMPFHRRMSAIRPVNRIKHVIDVEGALTGGTPSFTPIGVSVEVPTTPFKPGDMMFGSSVNGIFLSIFMIGASGAGQTGSLNWYIAKIRQGQTIGSLPAPGATGVNGIRNQIFHEEKGLAGSADGTPMAFKGVVAIPKGMRRMRQGDEFIVALQSTDTMNDVNFCIKAIYQSYQ